MGLIIYPLSADYVVIFRSEFEIIQSVVNENGGFIFAVIVNGFRSYLFAVDFPTSVSITCNFGNYGKFSNCRSALDFFRYVLVEIEILNADVSRSCGKLEYKVNRSRSRSGIIERIRYVIGVVSPAVNKNRVVIRSFGRKSDVNVIRF